MKLIDIDFRKLKELPFVKHDTDGELGGSNIDIYYYSKSPAYIHSNANCTVHALSGSKYLDCRGLYVPAYDEKNVPVLLLRRRRKQRRVALVAAPLLLLGLYASYLSFSPKSSPADPKGLLMAAQAETKVVERADQADRNKKTD